MADIINNIFKERQTSWENVCAFFEHSGLGVLDWLAQSPDLNPIEQLWEVIFRKVQNKKPSKLYALWQLLREAKTFHLWAKTKSIKHWTASFPRKISKKIYLLAVPTNRSVNLVNYDGLMYKCTLSIVCDLFSPKADKTLQTYKRYIPRAWEATSSTVLLWKWTSGRNCRTMSRNKRWYKLFSYYPQAHDKVERAGEECRYLSPIHLTHLNITHSDREQLRALRNIRLGVDAV